jgi:putative transcription antitermination factor YqgF
MASTAVNRSLRKLASRLYRPLEHASSHSTTASSSSHTAALLPPRVFALDVGTRFVGVAVSDVTNTEALPYTTIQRRRPVRTEASQSTASSSSSSSPTVHTKTEAEQLAERLRVPTAAELAAFAPRSMLRDVSRPLDTKVNVREFVKPNRKKKKPAAPPSTYTKRSRGGVAGATTASFRTAPIPFAQVVAPLREMVERFNGVAIVVGQPLKMDGSTDWMADEVRRFVDALRAEDDVLANTRFFLWDERCTTLAANEMLGLAKGGPQRQRRRRLVDKVAASVILQDFLDTVRTKHY